jgi:NAD(P)-dependent dehydrogenase (short-subunit alcohol dehydrogenase family)
VGALDGKVAIVTGGGQGLGRAHALTLAAEGATVVVFDIDAAAAGAVAGEIEAAGGQAAVVAGSVSDWELAKETVALAVSRFGDLHILVNNAGFARDRMMFSMTEEDWDSVVDVHLKGHGAFSSAVSVLWRDASKAGATVPRRIINTTSEAMTFGPAGQGNYGAAKAAIVSLTWTLARELAKYGVTANAIAPRARTNMTANVSFMKEDPGEGFDRYDPFHASKLVTWLATDAAGYVNGQVLIVVGGDILLLRPTHITRRVSSPEGWTLDTLDGAAKELFDGWRQGPPDPQVA